MTEVRTELSQRLLFSAACTRYNSRTKTSLHRFFVPAKFSFVVLASKTVRCGAVVVCCEVEIAESIIHRLLPLQLVL